MAHIVFITNGMAARLNSVFAMSQRLRNAGHRVTFVAQEDFGERITAQGEAFVGLEQDRRMSELIAANPRPSLARPIAMLQWLGYRRRLRRESIESDELTSTIRRLAPDVLLIDKDTDGEEQIERNIERTLSDPDIRRNVAAMHDRFHEYDQPDRAVELVESYIGRSC